MTTYLYVGFGDFVPGVPARDLSAEEWNAVPEAWREVAESLYQAVEREAQEARTRTHSLRSGQALADERGQEEEATTEEAEDGREDAGVVDDDPAGAADGGAGHRGVRGRRRGEAEGTT